MKAKKSLGQNFLSDKNVLESIVVFAGVTKESHVLEIGPGRGDLTERLLATGAQVKVIEVDIDLVPELQKTFGNNPHFSLYVGDILDLRLQDLYTPEEKYQVVANIPYYITAPIIRKLLTEVPTPERITLLVQKEVAERLAGDAKTRSVLTVSAHFYSSVELGPVIPKKYFDPIPKVDSQLVALTPFRKAKEEDKNFFRLVKLGFAARRKTLFNNLVAARFGTKEELTHLFNTLQWSLTRRAQDLEIQEWQELGTRLGLWPEATEERK